MDNLKSLFNNTNLKSLIIESRKDRDPYNPSNILNKSKICPIILPHYEDYHHKEYNILTQKDQQSIKDNFYFKCFYDPLSTIQDSDTLRSSSDLNIKTNLHIEYINEISFNIILEAPSYLYRQILVVSQDVRPTYSLYFDVKVFRSLFNVIKDFNNEKLGSFYGIHNGNFGSHPYHLHIHMTDKSNAIITYIQNLPKFSQTKFIYGSLKGYAFSDNSRTNLFNK